MTAPVSAASPEVIEKWRREFECAVKEKYPKVDFGVYVDDCYWTAWIDHLWTGFKMARQSVIIQLPRKRVEYDGMDEVVMTYHKSAEVRSAIESQGYRVEVKGE